jgi:putative peptidoglycan lipid II flippase
MVKKSFLLTILSFIITLISFINQLVIANYFGASIQMDTYIIASNIPLLISALFTSSLGYSLTPFLVQLKVRSGSDFSHYFGEIFNKILVTSLLIFTVIGISYVIFISNFNHTNNQAGIGFYVFVLSCMISIFNIIQSVFNSLFNSEGDFFFPVYLSFVPYFFSLLFVYLFSQSLGAIAISLGLFVGCIITLFLSCYCLRETLSFRINYLFVKSEYINKYLMKLPGVAISMLCFSIYQTIDSYWAPQIGLSNLSYLSYCQRILIALGALIISGPSTILVPRLTLSVEEGRISDFLNDVVLVFKLVFAFASIFAVIGSVISEDIVALLFERGQFTFNDTISISLILPYMLIGMVFMLCVVILFRAIFASKYSDKVIFLGILATMFYFVFSGIGSTYFGINGIAYSYIITWFLLMLIALYIIFKNNFSILINKNNLYFMLKHLSLIMIVAFAVYAAKNFSNSLQINSDLFRRIFLITVSGGTGVIIYFIFSVFVFKLNEVRTLVFDNIFVFKKYKN